MIKLIEKPVQKLQKGNIIPYKKDPNAVTQDPGQSFLDNLNLSVTGGIPTKYANSPLLPKNNTIESSKENDEEDEDQKDSKYQSQIPFNYGIKPNPLGIIPSLIKPAIAIGSAAFNLQQLKKEKAAALHQVAPKVLAPNIPIRPVQGLAPEIASLYEKNLAGMQIKKTSDATSNRIGEQMLDSSKMGALDKLSAAEVDNLFKERQRHDQLEVLNAQESAKAANEENKYTADVQNKQAMINAQYESAKQDFGNKWMDEALVQPMEKRITHNAGIEAVQNGEEWNRLQTMIVDRQNILHQQPSDLKTKKQLNELLDRQRLLERRSMPTYDQLSGYLFGSPKTS